MEMTRKELEDYIRNEARRRAEIKGASKYRIILRIIGKEVADSVERGEIKIVEKHTQTQEDSTPNRTTSSRLKKFFVKLLKR